MYIKPLLLFCFAPVWRSNWCAGDNLGLDARDQGGSVGKKEWRGRGGSPQNRAAPGCSGALLRCRRAAGNGAGMT